MSTYQSAESASPNGHAQPLDVARRLHSEGEQPSLLLAGAPGAHPARSILAIRPDETIVSPPGSGAGLPAIPPRMVYTAHDRGVWVGAIAYDAGLGLLGIGSRHQSTVPSFMAAWHATYAVFDHAADHWTLHGPAGAVRATLAAAIAEPLYSDVSLSIVAARTARSSCSRVQHADNCREAQRLIALGEMFEINLTHTLSVDWQGDGFALFERMLQHSPGDHSAYLSIGDTTLASISPESYLRIEGDRCETRPIKGTRRRGTDPEEDEKLAVELAASVKDRAENVMIVDLLRNDLTATAMPGSVRVESLCLLERTASVMHLVSVVSSRILDTVRLPDVMISCFPGGSITGAPKRRAMEIIDQLESGARGFYCGSIFGWEPEQERLVASIAIRTATLQNQIASYGAGGAVTLLSDPNDEAEETMIKARPFLRAVNASVEQW